MVLLLAVAVVVVGVSFVAIFTFWRLDARRSQLQADRRRHRRLSDPPGTPSDRRQPEGETVRKRTVRAQLRAWAMPAMAAVISTTALRMLLWLGATMFPEGSWAAVVAERTMALGGIDFAWACGIAAGGGIASLTHELRTTPARLTFLHAFGHLTCAQFAGLLAYLLAVQYVLALPLALVACGIAGWGGNRIIVLIESTIVRRLGLSGGTNEDAGRTP